MTVVTRSGLGVQSGLAATVKLSLRTFGFVGSVARFLILQDELRRFVQRAPNANTRAQRKQLLARFARIHRHVVCAHSPLQFAILAEHILGLNVPGDLVQCGVFKGGGTAKLSVLAKLTGRKLYVCDSFEGLPNVAESQRVHRAFGDLPDYVFGHGEYAGSFDEVRDNVCRYGELSSCIFVKGWFSDTLPSLQVSPALVFTDVDYVSSARDCLQSLWPKLAAGGLWFTHEASFLSYLEGIMDPTFWREAFDEPPPLLIGGGSGLSAAAPSLAYFRKSS